MILSCLMLRNDSSVFVDVQTKVNVPKNRARYDSKFQVWSQPKFRLWYVCEWKQEFLVK